MRSLRRHARAIGLLLAASLLPGLVRAEPVTPPEYRRSVEQTFLTYPEWFLVFSPAEYADYTRDHTPTRFPFLGHIGQFWGGYRAVCRATKAYPSNPDYHLMIWVIGTSTTIEYAARSAYQVFVGRLSEATQRHGLTEEDRLDAEIAQDYVTFIRLYPWYEYDFTRALERLWKETSLWGPDPIRKWERKYALTSELLIKAGYGWLIKKADRTVYSEQPLTTAVVLDRVPSHLAAPLPLLKVEKVYPDGSALCIVPRYDAFMEYAEVLARSGVGFREIAGNDGPMLVSVLTLPDVSFGIPGCLGYFAQPILTRPPWKRVVLSVPVASLNSFLAAAATSGVQIEHLYDY